MDLMTSLPFEVILLIAVLIFSGTLFTVSVVIVAMYLAAFNLTVPKLTMATSTDPWTPVHSLEIWARTELISKIKL